MNWNIICIVLLLTVSLTACSTSGDNQTGPTAASTAVEATSRDFKMPRDSTIIMRKDGEAMVKQGETMIQQGDMMQNNAGRGKEGQAMMEKGQIMMQKGKAMIRESTATQS